MFELLAKSLQNTGFPLFPKVKTTSAEHRNYYKSKMVTCSLQNYPNPTYTHPHKLVKNDYKQDKKRKNGKWLMQNWDEIVRILWACYFCQLGQENMNCPIQRSNRRNCVSLWWKLKSPSTHGDTNKPTIASPKTWFVGCQPNPFLMVQFSSWDFLKLSSKMEAHTSWAKNWIGLLWTTNSSLIQAQKIAARLGFFISDILLYKVLWFFGSWIRTR